MRVFCFFRYDGHGFRLEEALKGCNSEQPIILLAHQPRAAKQALQSSHHIDLVLSGRQMKKKINEMVKIHFTHDFNCRLN